MIKFIKFRVPALIFSLVILIFGLWYFLGSYIMPKNLDIGFFNPRGLNLGIDFQGGLVHQVTIYSGISSDEIREFANKSGLGSEVQQVVISDKKRIGKADSYLIKTIITKEEQEIINNNPDLTPAKFLNNRVKEFYGMIKAKYGETYILKGEELKKANLIYEDKITGEKIDLRTDEQKVLENVVKESENVISPVYSKSLRLQATLLMLFVLVVFLIYITFRFKFKYAVGAVFALIHDVLIIMGFITFIYLEFDYTIVAAILFIIGYSINDTIVIFDRVRENYSIMIDYSSKEVINTSINQSLSRTIITSFTTLLAVMALYIWGGPKINGFALTLIVGIFCGTYSSIFIAAPVVDSWDGIFMNKKAKLKELKKEGKKIVKEQAGEVEEKNVIGKTPEKISFSKKQLKKISSMKKKK
ncbi:MAG: protein translocase subunit SecF [Spirochaetes bacterium]|nr:protein translocase subunit SecF [Spirochaetota bacterium]